ncbi:MAG: porphobilinogen synthase [Chloroflexi bacterium]|nr:porphobilinogen synthase [Chloroflexota bacterium]
MSYFPVYRPRRLRINENVRRMVRETVLTPADFVYPLFVVHGEQIKREIISMPGNYHWSLDMLAQEAEEIASLGIPAVILFGIPAEKDPVGLENFADEGIVQQAARAIKEAVPDLMVITDICLCEYTDHGHCGLIKGDAGGSPELFTESDGLPDGYILNDESLEILGQVAVSHARAGADMIAPSGMLDGMIKAIRDALDAAGYAHVSILSYAAKYASAFYGPFRDAAESPPSFGDRSSYQMDPANAREALREVALDIQEGADIIMVKPALPYLDIIRMVRDAVDYPIAAYNVSGEYAMVKAAAQKGWIDERRVALESLVAIKRAGADVILTYWAKDAARWLASGG